MLTFIYYMNFKRLFSCILIGSIFSLCIAQVMQRPFIWATAAEKPGILEKIEKNDWAKSFYRVLYERSLNGVKSYMADKNSYLMSNFSFKWVESNGERCLAFNHMPLPDKKKNEEIQNLLIKNMQLITDCAVCYYLTDDKQFAQTALDISYTIVKALNQTRWNEENKGNGGWIYPDDNLREVRYISVLPIVYDFIYPYITSGVKAYDVASKSMVIPDMEVYRNAFLTYARSAVEHGHSGSNWSVLESPCLVQCALAMDDLSLRNKYLDHYLNKSVATQDCLADVAKNFKNEGDVWPETSSYSGYVADFTTYLMFLLTKYDPDLHLGRKYINIPLALPRWNDLIFPDGKLPLFGDGTRTPVVPSRMEVAYSLAKLDNLDVLKKKIGSLLVEAMNRGTYKRPALKLEYELKVDPYVDPALLLWSADKIEEKSNEIELSRTDALPHAGLFLQRNLSPSGDYKDGLMAVVMGASHVHSHAGGMNIELYGKGTVLGVDAGPGDYRTDIHENYYRLFAAHNCVVSNGSSSSLGGWVGLGTSTVKKVSMEPLPREEAVAQNYSYTTTSFIDKTKQGPNALHERTLAIVRTSASTGYYVDIFRAKSDKEKQYHDYIYHNLADEVKIKNKLKFKDTPERYMANASNKWIQNGMYRYPGWHFFKNVKTAELSDKNIEGIFSAKELGEQWLNMKFFIPQSGASEFTLTDAPKMKRAPQKYINKPTPTFIIRKEGEAWNNPFAVVYEPTEGDSEKGSIESVDEILDKGKFKGLIVRSVAGGKKIVQYILSQDKNDSFKCAELDLVYKGHFAVITWIDNSLAELYVGDGNYLRICKTEISSVDKKNTDFYAEKLRGNLIIRKSNSEVKIVEHK